MTKIELGMYEMLSITVSLNDVSAVVRITGNALDCAKNQRELIGFEVEEAIDAIRRNR